MFGVVRCGGIKLDHVCTTVSMKAGVLNARVVCGACDLLVFFVVPIVKRNRKDKAVRIFEMIIHRSFVPNFISCLIINVTKITETFICSLYVSNIYCLLFF